MDLINIKPPPDKMKTCKNKLSNVLSKNIDYSDFYKAIDTVNDIKFITSHFCRSFILSL